ncbi:hypothetical protein BHE90_007718 [Fusarium euwallaceae]|uniref:Transcription factor domain-containing protein n=1 Tax=Fusarium euwallaceae TaxID=1147111 RepID=A0A430LQ41_9HYPO|nr:hypothetical protein BHE90_007718 [Fusarium euwallaceae]
MSEQTRKQTADVRNKGACMRCHMQKLQGRGKERLGKVVCQRLNIRDAISFRMGNSKFGQETASVREYPLWVESATTRTITLIRPKHVSPSWPKGGTLPHLDILVKEFVPSDKDITAERWRSGQNEVILELPAFSAFDNEATTDALLGWVNDNFDLYAKDMTTQPGDYLIGATFAEALRYVEMNPDSMVKKALNIWIGARMAQEFFCVVEDNDFDIKVVDDRNSIHHGQCPVPPVLDHQLDVLMIQKMIQMQDEILADIERVIRSRNSRTRWYEIYLTIFVMLANLQYVYKSQERWWEMHFNTGKGNAIGKAYRSISYKFMERYKFSSRNLLSHFRYGLKGPVPFTLDWNKESNKKLGDLDRDAVTFVKFVSATAIRRRDEFEENARRVKNGELELNNNGAWRSRAQEDEPSSALLVEPVMLGVRFRSGLDSTDEYAFADNQVWVQPESNLEYCDETAQLSQIYETEDRELNFTENMALWADATDLRRHFEIEVPRRSMYFPVLRYAVFAFSSRHLNRNMSDTTTEALEYYDRCLSLLIEAVAEQNGPVDEETLAAIAILRQYEEMDADDKELHLNGTSRIVNSMSVFDFNGGLGEAAAWLCLRQDIYISLTKQRPLRSDLDTYLQSDVFKRMDDAAYANKMVFLLAKALACAFSSDKPCSVDSLEEIRREVDSWFDLKSPAFNPIHEAKRSREEGRLLPEIWVLSPFHAVGLQYYHIAKIILAMSTPIVASSVLEHIRQGKRVEQIVRNHLLQVIALANSHARAENALFTARHSLSVWGGVFAEKDDQEMVLSFLEHVQQRTGWNTSPLRSSLQEQWIQDNRE